eukprot:gene16183-17810_t
MAFSQQNLTETCRVEEQIVPRTVEMITLVLIGFVALVGNSLVIAVVSRSHRVQWVANLFVAHLAAVNLFVPIISVPFYFHWSLLRKWALGDATCKIVQFSHLLNAGMSVCMLTCIAVDRYYVVVHPLTLHLRRSQTFQIITFIWIFIIFLCTPSLYFYKLRSTECESYCETDFKSNSWGGFFIAFSLCAFLLPLLILTILYLLVLKTIYEREQASKSQDLQTTQLSNIDRNCTDVSKYQRKGLGKVPKTKRKVIKMLMIQNLIFMICWLPYFINEFNNFVSKKNQVTLSPVYLWMCYSNATINPILYALLNSNFRKGCRHLVNLHISQPYTLQALQRKHQVGVVESIHMDSEEDREYAMRDAAKKHFGNGNTKLHSRSGKGQLEDVSPAVDEGNKNMMKMFQASSTLPDASAWK